MSRHLLVVSNHAKLTLESLLAELLLLKHSAEVREVHQSVVPSHHVGEVFPELWVKQLRRHNQQKSPNWLLSLDEMAHITQLVLETENKLFFLPPACYNVGSIGKTLSSLAKQCQNCGLDIQQALDVTYCKSHLFATCDT